MKLPFQYVAKHVNALVRKPVNLSNVEEVAKHRQFIHDFIVACGWDELDLANVMFAKQQPSLTEEQLRKLN